MTVTTRNRPTGADTVPITCAPHYDGTEEVIPVWREWLPVAEKLVAAGAQRRKYSSARGGERLQRLNDAWDEIRKLWDQEARPLGMPKQDAAMLLGISRQGLDNILSYKVGGRAVRMDPQRAPCSRPGTAQIRSWARANGVEIAPFGPIPQMVRNAYERAVS